MKKEYDFFVNKRNTPHLDLYTKLIGIFYFFLGTNMELSFLYSKYLEQQEYAGCCLVLGVLMYSMIFTNTKDPRREDRGLTAVVLDGVVHAVCTFGVAYVLSFRILVLVYIFEMIYVTKVVWKYFKFQKKK